MPRSAVHIRYEITDSRANMIVGQNNWYLLQPSRDGDSTRSAAASSRLSQLPSFKMAFSAGEVIEGWLMVEVVEDRLADDLYIAFADAGPFTEDECCSATL